MRFISLGHPFPGCRMADIKILLADDHSLVRASLKSLLADFPGIEVIAEAGNGREALELIAKYRPELVLMNISMPGLDGLEATPRVVKNPPTLHLVIPSIPPPHANAPPALPPPASP